MVTMKLIFEPGSGHASYLRDKEAVNLQWSFCCCDHDVDEDGDNLDDVHIYGREEKYDGDAGVGPNRVPKQTDLPWSHGVSKRNPNSNPKASSHRLLGQTLKLSLQQAMQDAEAELRHSTEESASFTLNRRTEQSPMPRSQNPLSFCPSAEQG